VTLSLLRFTNFIGPSIETPLTRYFSLPVVPTVFGFDPRIQLCHEDDGIEVLARAVREEHQGIFNVGGSGVLLLSQAIRRLGKAALPVPSPAVSLVARAFRSAGPRRLLPEQMRYLEHGRVADVSRLQAEFAWGPRPTSEAFDDFVATRAGRASSRPRPSRPPSGACWTCSTTTSLPVRRGRCPCLARSTTSSRSSRGRSAAAPCPARGGARPRARPRGRAVRARAQRRRGPGLPAPPPHRRLRGRRLRLRPRPDRARAAPAAAPAVREVVPGRDRGLDNVPDVGGALVVANHSGTIPMDAVMTALALLDHHPAHRHLRMLGADLVFKLPVVAPLARKAGNTLACNADAERLLSGGELVGVWPRASRGSASRSASATSCSASAAAASCPPPCAPACRSSRARSSGPRRSTR
jgi:hypothetical protein